MNNTLSIQEIIAEMKTNYGVTDEDIASKLGITAMTVWRWGNGKSKPRSKIIIRALFDYKDQLNHKE
jgi:transcriptional regulator with XRE-family HTH domain